MYSKEVATEIRKDFWIAFDTYSRKYLGPKRKWILYNTGLKDFVLKFEINRKFARVMFAFENKDEDKRFNNFVKLKEYEITFINIIGNSWIWEEQLINESGKEVCALYKQIDDVNIYKKEDWSKIFEFFASNMFKLEQAFVEVKPFIEEYIKFNK